MIEEIKWVDTRLVYNESVPDVTDYHLTHWIDLASGADSIWKPTITYNDHVKVEVKENQYYLFPTGMVFWVRKLELAFKCPFDFVYYPNDK